MKLYYTWSFDKEKCDSHRLLETVIKRELAAEGFAGDTEAEACRLVGTMETCTEHGKPVIREFRDFSISHSGSCWAVLIADDPCGLDIQQHRDIDPSAIIRKYYSHAEQECVRTCARETCDETGPNREFYRIWARREALVKAVGTTVVNTKLPCVIDECTEFEGKTWKLQDAELPDADERGFSAAVCVNEAEASQIEYISLDEQTD